MRRLQTADWGYTPTDEQVIIIQPKVGVGEEVRDLEPLPKSNLVRHCLKAIRRCYRTSPANGPNKDGSCGHVNERFAFAPFES
jgi:hypothetical protein